MTKRLIFIYLLAVLLASTSCLVSKKKYLQLENEKKSVQKRNKNLSDDLSKRQKEIETLNTNLAKTLTEYNDVKNTLLENNAKKTSEIDSLSNAVMGLTSDTMKLKTDLKKAIASYETERNKMLELSKELENKTKVMNDLNADLAEKNKKLDELQKMIDANKSQVELLRNTISDALNAFDKTDLTVYQKDGKVYVSLQEKLLFAVGSDKVAANGVKALKELAKVLEENAAIDIMIEGHTDNTGDAKLNWDLSVRRATSIVNILQTNSKIEPKRFTASGRGMYIPLGPANTSDARTKNRRTEIILTPKLDALYDILNEGTE